MKEVKTVNKDEYTRWSNTILDVENPDIQGKKAQEKYEELTAGMTITVIAHDWKDYDNHMREVCKKVKELDATTMHYFPSFHDFPNGSLDSIITVASKGEISEEFAEILADLVVNLGAEGS